MPGFGIILLLVFIVVSMIILEFIKELKGK